MAFQDRGSAQQEDKLRKLVMIVTLTAIAGVLCGFSDAAFLFNLNAYRGEPVRDALARLGPPVQRSYNQGQRIYYWHTAYGGGRFVCKIWGSARGSIITNWGYQDCAF
jgi:hypothetical protein